MIDTDRELAGRAAVLAATDHHPFVRHAVRPDDAPRAWARDGAVAWLLPAAENDRAGGVVGPVDAAVELVAALVADGVVRPGQYLQLPRANRELLVDRFAATRVDDWDFLWTTAAPPRQPGQERVVRLGRADHPALAALIDDAFPTSSSRPQDPTVTGWYGIWDADRLVACGADRSRGDVGFLAGLTVARDRRGQGLGAALTAGMTRALLARYDHVALGVYTDNVGALRLYRRLGFTGTLERSSVWLG
ncbi:N-acetyltransferase [Micromonospora sp. HM134]|uniref:GNAT family N-acetyltransferase n=1 Tax=Micromonospora sp. HM134 TaxID=2583243 RepID=UPI0011984FED|nr:GNAT family N-acetyltransferase [Micromonospora sp. HM134]QDY07601.1 N-acetyltransferase [Micromonospora sp. HM134]